MAPIRHFSVTAFLLLAFLVSCNRDEYHSYEANSYVLGYKTMTQTVLRVEGNWIMVYADYDELIWENNKKELFDSQNRAHADQGLPRTVKYIVPGKENVFLYPDFLTIDIVCHEAYDESHPAHTSIADLVTFCSLSSISHIRSGYKDTYQLSDSLGDQPQIAKLFADVFQLSPEDALAQNAVVCPLASATSQDLMLLGRDMSMQVQGNPTAYPPFSVLVIGTPPAQKGLYHLDVILQGSDGKTYSASVDYPGT